jgi:spore maturation protein CgeB
LIFSYEPSLQFPPPAHWSDADRNRQVSFIGSPYEERPAFLHSLAEQHQLPLAIAGPRWEGIYPAAFAREHLTGGMLMDEEYTDGLWRSRVNLAFITRLNEDDVAHKSFEIAACGQFLLACRSEEHMAVFAEDSEAAFYSSLEECASKARFYLDRPELRKSFGERARLRAVSSGYDNDTQLAKVLARLDGGA